MASIHFFPNPDDAVARAAEFLSDRMGFDLTNAVEFQEFTENAKETELELEEFMDRAALLKVHAGTLWTIANGSAIPIENYYFRRVGNASGVKKLKPRHRIDIATLIKSVDLNRSLKGKFFLCRTLCVPVIHSAAFQTVVDEPCVGEGSKAASLICSLHDDPRGKTPEEFLPIGTILVIKHPTMQRIVGCGYGIKNKDQKNLLILQPDQMAKLFPGLKWETEIQPDETEKAKLEVAMEMKENGNAAFSQKLFTEAIDHYSQGLMLDPQNVDLLSNRAACHLNMRCYARALDDSEMVLETEPFHLKGIYRKVKAQWGLQKYKAAREFLEEKYNANLEVKNSTNLSNLLEKAEKVLRQSETGKHYELDLYLVDDMRSHDVGEYIGSVEKSKDPRKGIIATEDIEPGQLLICSKAFSIFFTGPDPEQKMYKNNESMVLELAKLTYFKLEMEPELKEWFYEMPTAVNSHWTSSGGTEMDNTYNMVVNNSSKFFGSMVALPGTDENELDERIKTSGSSIGLWTFSSYIKDGCFDSNCIKITVGDLQFVRATKSIRKGEEILISLDNFLMSYPIKRERCRNRGYVCHCRLCTIDSGDLDSTHEFRENFMKSMSLRFLRAAKKPKISAVRENDNVELLIKWIATLRELRPKNPELNVHLMIPMLYLAEMFYFNKEFVHAITLWKESYGLAVVSGSQRNIIAFSASIADCYIHLNRKEEANYWIETLKKDLMIYYGTMDVLKYYERDILANIVCYGIRFL